MTFPLLLISQAKAAGAELAHLGLERTCPLTPLHGPPRWGWSPLCSMTLCSHGQTSTPHPQHRPYSPFQGSGGNTSPSRSPANVSPCPGEVVHQTPCFGNPRSALERNTIISAVIIMAPRKVTSVEHRAPHTPLSPYHLHLSRAAPREMSLNPRFTDKETEAQTEKGLSPHTQGEVESEFKPRPRRASSGSSEALQQAELALNPASSSLSKACAPAPLTQAFLIPLAPSPSAPQGVGLTPKQGALLEAMARRRGKPPSIAHRLREQQAAERGRDGSTVPRPPPSEPCVLAPDQLFHTPPRAPGSLTLLPLPSPLHIHLTSPSRGQPYHWRKQGAGVPLQRMQPMGPEGQGRGGPRPGRPQTAEQAPGPALSVLPASARLSLNKQGCIATAALKEPVAPA